MIRLMTDSDWKYVSRIYKQGMDSGMATFQTEVPSYEVWSASHIAGLRYVDEENGKVTGFVVLSPTSSRQCYSGVCELSIYIDEEYRGKGIGNKLMMKMITESENSGIWCIYSSLFDNNQASIALHRKCGFREIGYREKISKEPLTGKWRSTVLFERRSKLKKYN